MKITKPMLAATLTVEDLDKIKYPVMVTPKLDGVRALMVDGKLVSRTFKPIPNNHIRTTLEAILPDGVDGELMIQDKPFSEATGDIMRVDGKPDFYYWAFDYLDPKLDICEDYGIRVRHLKALRKKSKFTAQPWNVLYPAIVTNRHDLLEAEDAYLSHGYEGLMIRSPNSPYKFGRSTVKEGYLLKLKRFIQEEATVIGFEELMHNDNEAEKDAFGRTKRSSHQENLRPAGTLGKLIVVDIKTKLTFGLGTGYTAAQRQKIWDNRMNYLGAIVTYKCQEVGAKDAPRFPVWLGFRDPIDL